MKKLEIKIEEVIEDFRKVFNEQGSLTTRIYKEHGKFNLSTLKEHFGTFNKLKEMSIGKQTVSKKNITLEEVIEDVLKVKGDKDTISRDFYIKHGKFSRKPIDRLFGSWNNLLNELGMKINCRPNIPEEELLNELKRLQDKFETISATVIKEHGAFSIEVYQRRFGSINKAYELAGLEIKQSKCSSPIADSMIKMISEILNETPIKEYTNDWLVNQETKKHLYIDAYFPESNLAFEYNGPQHYEPIKKYGSEEGLLIRQKLDSLKQNLLKEKGIPLYTMHYLDKKDRASVLKQVSQFL